MPRRAQVTREAIVDAAFALVREEGHGRLNARSLAARLSCSTQPILYQFDSMEDVRREVYARADAFHSAYITAGLEEAESPLMRLGLNYVRFGHEEPHLFRLLFQENGLGTGEVATLFDDPTIAPLIALVSREAGLDGDAARQAFSTLFFVAHGYASLLANNALAYDEALAEATLVAAFSGARSCEEESHDGTA